MTAIVRVQSITNRFMSEINRLAVSVLSRFSSDYPVVLFSQGTSHLQDFYHKENERIRLLKSFEKKM